MFCEIILLPNETKDLKKLKEYLVKEGRDYQIVSNSHSVIEFLKTIKDECYLLEDSSNVNKEIATKIYQESLDILNEYKKKFESISYKEIEVFKVFEYSFLQQLMVLKKVEHVLLENKNIILIFVRMFPIYFSILDIANNIGYKNNKKICIIDGNEIKYKKFNEYKSPNKLLKSKSATYFKNGLVRNFTIVNIKSIIKIIKSVLVLNLQKQINKILKKSFDETSKKIQKRITKLLSNKKLQCMFFVTSSGREDIYLNPWYPIFSKLSEMKIPFIVSSGDVVTNSILHNKKIDFLNLFQDINLLSDILKNSDEGKKLENQIKKIIDSSKIEGIASLSNYLKDEIFRSISIIEIIEPILLKNKLETTVGIADSERLERTMFLLAKKLKIKNFSMLPTVPNPVAYLADWIKADKIFVQGQKGIEVLEELGYDKNKLILTGNPKYDFFEKLNIKKLKKQIVEKFNLPFQKIILVAMSRWHKDDEKWMVDLIKFGNINKLGIIIKIHPAYKISNHIESESKIKFIERSCETKNFRITYDENIYELIAASDILITEFSMVGIEACLLKKPIITVNFSNQDLGNYNERLDKVNASFYIKNYESLERLIYEILENNQIIEKLKEPQKTICRLYNYSNDGKASERIISYLLEEK